MTLCIMSQIHITVKILFLQTFKMGKLWSQAQFQHISDFLLSRRLIGELITHGPSSIRRPQCSNIFFSETVWLIKAKFYMEPPWVGRAKVCSRHPCHMTKISATPIYGKNPSKIFFSGTGGRISTKLDM